MHKTSKHKIEHQQKAANELGKVVAHSGKNPHCVPTNDTCMKLQNTCIQSQIDPFC